MTGHFEEVSQWKDYSHDQTASSTSISAVTIALLKAILDQNPDTHEYYYAVATMLIINIVLSIVCGVLIIMIFYSR